MRNFLLEKKVSARFDVHAKITERAYRILKTVLKFMFFEITHALVQLGIKFYTYDILTVEKLFGDGLINVRMLQQNKL